MRATVGLLLMFRSNALASGCAAGQHPVEGLLQGLLGGPELQDGVAQEQQDERANPPLHGEEAQDRRLPELASAQHHGRVVRGTSAVRLADDERLAAQAAPGHAGRGLGVQPLRQLGLGRLIGDVPVPRAAPQAPVHDRGAYGRRDRTLLT